MTLRLGGRAQTYFTSGGGVVGLAGPGPLGFGADDIGTTTTTRWLYAGYSDDLAETSPHRLQITEAGTIRDLYILHGTPAGNGNNVVYTVYVNGAPTALTVTLASTGNTANDTVNTVAVNAGDTISLEVTKAAGIGVSPSNVRASFEFVA